MKVEEVKGLIKEFVGSDLTRLKLKSAEFELELEKEKEMVYAAPALPVAQAPIATTEVNINTEARVESVGRQIKAPMVGTFYASNSPKSKPFVSVGSKVKKGDIICIIEAMKLMNEVEADMDGEILEVLIENEAMVEFDQPMFVIK